MYHAFKFDYHKKEKMRQGDRYRDPLQKRDNGPVPLPLYWIFKLSPT